MKSQKNLIIVYLTTLLAAACLSKLEASDPDLIHDFFVPEGVNITTIGADYFTSHKFIAGAPVADGKLFGINKATIESFPALTGLGVSMAYLAYLPGGVNSLHIHPRGTELLYLISGSLEVGLVDSTNKLYTQALYAGDLFVFPKGLVHYQINQDTNVTATALSAFSSSNPGLVSLGTTIFGTQISEKILSKSFGVSEDVIEAIEKSFAAK